MAGTNSEVSSSGSDEAPKPGRPQRLSMIKRRGGPVAVEHWPPSTAERKMSPYPVGCEYPYYYHPPYNTYYPHYSCNPPVGLACNPNQDAAPRPSLQPMPPQAPTMSGALQPITEVSAPALKHEAIHVSDTHSSATDSESESFSAPVSGMQRRSRWDGVRIHYCYRCGRFRSKSFHYQNPAVPGGRPLVGTCSRCKTFNGLSNPFGYGSGRIVGERWVVKPYRSQKSRLAD